MPITRLVKMTFRSDAINTFLELFEKKKQLIRDFPGCNHLELWQDLHDPSICFTCSRWETQMRWSNTGILPFLKIPGKPQNSYLLKKPRAWSVEIVHSS